MAPGGGKAGWGTGSSSGTACNIHTEGVLVGHDKDKKIISINQYNNIDDNCDT